jgi:hypothetical protein
MWNFLEFIPKGKTLSCDAYTCYDEIYSIWELGFNLGEILCTHQDQKEDIKQAVENFELNCSKVRCTSKILNGDRVPDLNEIQKCISLENYDFRQLVIEVHKVKDSLSFELRIFSTHLAHVFSFGFAINELRAIMVYNRGNAKEIKAIIDKTLTIVDSLEKGDKKLESNNLEISRVNLHIFRSSLKEIKRNIPELIVIAEKKPDQYNYFIENGFIKMLTDIVLDIKNPLQHFQSKILIWIIYYVVIVIMLSIAELIWNWEGRSFFHNFKFDTDNIDILISAGLPLIYLLVIFVRYLNYFILWTIIPLKLKYKIYLLGKGKSK